MTPDPLFGLPDHARAADFQGQRANLVSVGLTRDELKAILTQITIYCGVPTGVECFRIARKVFAEQEAG